MSNVSRINLTGRHQASLHNTKIPVLGSPVAQWFSVELRSERSEVPNLPPPCVLEQDTLLPKSTGLPHYNTIFGVHRIRLCYN